MENDIKEAIAQQIAERVEGKNLTPEQVELVTSKVMAQAESSVAPTPPAPIEPKFADNLFNNYSIGANLESTQSGNKIVNTKPTQNYEKVWETRLKQKSYTPEELQAEVTKKN